MKGISPFIAEILLIGFTVAIAGIIITWSSQFARTSTQTVAQQSESQLACSYGGISTFGDIVYSNGYLSGYLKNTGTIPLKVYFQIFYDNQSSTTSPTIAEIPPGNLAFFNVSTPSNINFIYVLTNCTSPSVSFKIDRSQITFS